MLAYIDGAYRGSSTDRAAMTSDVIRNQEAFIEVDTGKLYFYDAENSQWVEFTAASSSGGDTLASAAQSEG